jgi:lysyl-tRNA synthetase, class II
MRDNLRQTRIDKLAVLAEAGIASWPDRFERTHTLAECMALPDDAKGVRTAGRLVGFRSMGKLAFGHLQDLHGRIQIMVSRAALHEDDEESRRLFKLLAKQVDLWDHIGVEGEMTRTRTGELTIRVSGWTFLGKAMQPPPDKFKGIRQQETAWRRRYVDLVTNEESRNRFKVRTSVVRGLRRYLDDHTFDEVDTPVLCNTASGALARPFSSHHNALDMGVVLRIAPETYLKRCIVAGYDRVFEFARCFRNEGWAPSHLQEFTMLEFYAAYWNYEDNMAFTEAMLRHVIQEACGTLQIQRGETVIDFAQPWPRLTLRDVILEHAGIDIDDHADAESLRAAVLDAGIGLDRADAGRGSLIDQLYKRTARPKLIQPTFIVRHPIDLSPLARSSDDNPGTVDRFQLVIDTWEVLNAYSELVDPIDQRQRLEEQAGLRAAGDDEAMPLDEDYLLAMEHGMPPISGWGMGIERFVALLTGAPNLRDVVLFPLMRKLDPNADEEGEGEGEGEPEASS